MSEPIRSHRPRAEKQDLRAFPAPDATDVNEVYVGRPQVLRTNQETVLVFGIQKLSSVRGSPEERRLYPRATPNWAVSVDGGRYWNVSGRPPELGRILQASHGEPLGAGRMSVITFHRPGEQCFSLVQKGEVGWAPDQTNLPLVSSEPLRALGEYGNFWFSEMTGTSDGALLAAGWGLRSGEPPRGGKPAEVFFLRSQNDGRSFGYCSAIPNPDDYWLSEPTVLAGESGYVLAVMQANALADGKPANFLFQSYSLNCGRTWTAPELLETEGQSPSLIRLRNGFTVLISMISGETCSIRTVLSDDDGATWNTQAVRRVQEFTPEKGEFGDARAVQLQDGTILCAYRKYTVEDHPGDVKPCGIFVSLFDEDWVRRGEVS